MGNRDRQRKEPKKPKQPKKPTPKDLTGNASRATASLSAGAGSRPCIRRVAWRQPVISRARTPAASTST
jgi:hypothetical protein